jgi:hypothetical protein
MMRNDRHVFFGSEFANYYSSSSKQIIEKIEKNKHKIMNHCVFAIMAPYLKPPDIFSREPS